MILSEECLKLYKDMYPDDYIAYFVPSHEVIIESGDITYMQTSEETDEMFIDRLERCKSAGRNLFYEEWELFEFEDGVDY